jgi:hypothetical protein
MVTAVEAAALLAVEDARRLNMASDFLNEVQKVENFEKLYFGPDFCCFFVL